MSTPVFRAARGAAIGVTAAAALCLGTAVPAQADGSTWPGTEAGVAATTPLSLPTVADVAATRQHVFISGGANSTEIVVTDPDGQITGSITGLQGPTGLEVTPDGRRLYVAVPAANAVAAFDARTLERTGWYPTGADTCPGTLAVAGNRLWFGYGCEAGKGDVGMIDLARPQRPRVHLGLLPTAASSVPKLGLPAARHDLLVVGSSSALASYAVGPAPGGRLALTPVSATNINVVAMSVAPDGSLVYVTTGGQDARSYRTEDMTTPAQQYFVDMERGTGVALSPGGRYLAYAVQMMSVALGVFVLNPSDATVVSHTFVSVTQRGRLVWSPDGSRIYIVLQRVSASPTPPQPVLNVIRPVLP